MGIFLDVKKKFYVALKGLIKQARGSTKNYHNVQKDLWEEYEEIILQEEVYWYQRARCDWINLGDKNTRFYHLSVKVKKSKKRIDMLKNTEGEWCTDQEELSSMAINFYKNLYALDGDERILEGQPHMNLLVGQNQCIFVSGRNGYDNIIIAHEIIHFMERRKGKKGLMAIKVDLEKAYDRIRWDFLRETLGFIGLGHHMIELIMKCVSTARMRVIWNGDHYEAFNMERGIRQGDPLSPYLFVLCMERLGHMINDAVVSKTWRPVRLSRNGTLISHLFFADDLFLLLKLLVLRWRIS